MIKKQKYKLPTKPGQMVWVRGVVIKEILTITKDGIILSLI